MIRNLPIQKATWPLLIMVIGFISLCLIVNLPGVMMFLSGDEIGDRILRKLSTDSKTCLNGEALIAFTDSNKESLRFTLKGTVLKKEQHMEVFLEEHGVSIPFLSYEVHQETGKITWLLGEPEEFIFQVGEAGEDLCRRINEIEPIDTVEVKHFEPIWINGGTTYETKIYTDCYEASLDADILLPLIMDERFDELKDSLVGEEIEIKLYIDGSLDIRQFQVGYSTEELSFQLMLHMSNTSIR